MKHARWSLVSLLTVAVVGCGGGHQRHNRYTVSIDGRSLSAAHPPGFGLPPKGKPLPTQPSLSQTSTLEMYDSVDVGTVPSCDAGCAVAGYTGGSWPTFFPLVHQFPAAFHVPIAVYNGGTLTAGGTSKIMCLDIEPGDASPSDAGPWARYVRTHGMRACEYSSLSEMSAVRQNLSAYGELSTTILWDANWTYSRHLDAGYSCTQWTDRSHNSNLDESTCATSLFGPPPPPADPYAIFQNTTYDLGNGVKANEQSTVKDWDKQKCRNPVRRPVCVNDRKLLVLLRGRIIVVANRSHPPDYSTGHRYKRVKYIERQLAQTKGPWGP